MKYIQVVQLHKNSPFDPVFIKTSPVPSSHYICVTLLIILSFYLCLVISSNVFPLFCIFHFIRAWYLYPIPLNLTSLITEQIITNLNEHFVIPGRQRQHFILKRQSSLHICYMWPWPNYLHGADAFLWCSQKSANGNCP